MDKKEEALKDFEGFVQKVKAANFESVESPYWKLVNNPNPKPKVYHTSKKDEWGTPPEFFTAVQEIFHLDLDAAATPANALLPVYLTPEMNSLQIQWWGRVWCNPPYSETKAFIEKAIVSTSFGHTEVCVLLVAARPDTLWFWKACRYAAEVRFLKGRLAFTDGDGKAKFPAPFPSCLLVFDKKCPTQAMGVWDWKADLTQPYEFGSASPEVMVVTELSQVPPEIKEALTDLQDLMGATLGKYAIVGSQPTLSKLAAKAKDLYGSPDPEEGYQLMTFKGKPLVFEPEGPKGGPTEEKIAAEKAYLKKVLDNLKLSKP